ncbi:ADP-ribosyl-[dinitrogen reductase] hydrolase [Magnetospirillum fulvum]|jgi:ADP-ribosyl-[dinitrogen reductase] hydrolase|uniref:ADP-ribosyl-(Dinitrogen reductase) hydrolase n=1 Tax=Magnetospirillum fulvum MGU-K5 TaxID=1316936 RepID=S9SH21_MAGFU|nr:ADP-ribosyl-[dinitrogen reductase] hydrolase [Magnetospirillum fulvum]EPY03423.1 ADP-ribosyl-(dinitrogen reductase) hydrolase [Magnetospirillum fulvum MGU-K5]
MTEPSLIERALGAYLGFAVGDALGATVEFMTRGEIEAKYRLHRKMIGGGWLHLAPGQVTDDTEMSLCLGRSLIRRQGFDLPDICDEFAAWLKSGPVDVGNTCRRGIRRYITNGSVEGAYCDGDAGNGAAMRNLPLALATLGRPDLLDRWSIAQAHITHNHPLSDDATLALARMTQALVEGRGMREARDVARQLVETHKTFRFEVFHGQSTAYIVDTMQTVLHFYFLTDSFRSCLTEVVNQGGDADTTGAIAGMLAGATYGVRDIPAAWLGKLDKTVAEEIRAQVTGLLALSNVLKTQNEEGDAGNGRDRVL